MQQLWFFLGLHPKPYRENW